MYHSIIFRNNSGIESSNEDVYSKLDQLLMFKPNNNNPYDCSKKAKITLRKSLLFKTDPKNKENIKDRKDMLCSTPIVKGHSNNPFPSDISSINSFDNETENLVNDYQNGQFEAVVHEPHRLSSPSQIRQNRKKIKCRKSCNNSLSHTICDKTNLAIDNVNPKTYKSDTYDNSNPLAMDDINNSSDLKDTPKLLRGKTKGGKLMSVVNKLLNSALSKNEPTTKNKQSVQRTINFNCSSTTPVNDFTLYKTLYSHNEIKKRECPWESEVQDLLLLDKMENTQRMFPRPTTAHEHFPDVTSLGKSNRSRASLVIEEIRAVKSAETVPIEDEENSQIHSEDKIIQFGQSIMPMGQTENEVVAKIVNSNDLFKTRTQTKKYSYNKLSEGKHVSSSPKHSTGPDFYNLTDDERTNSTNIRENSSNNVIISRKLKRKLPAMENTIITHNRKIHSKSTRIEDEDIIQEESLEKSLQTIKENNQRQIEESVGKLNSSVNTKTEVLLENYSKQIEDWIKPLKQPERDDTTKSEQLIKTKTLNSKNDNKTSKREKGVRESTRKSLRNRKIASSGLLYNCYILETKQKEKSKPNKLKTNLEETSTFKVQGSNIKSNVKSVRLEKVLDTVSNKQSKDTLLKSRKSKNNTIKNHADNCINQKPDLENVIEESNDVVCIPSTSECKENSTATRRGRRKKKLHTLSNETNILSIRGELINYDTINKKCEPNVKNTIQESNDVACVSNTSDSKESATVEKRGRKRNEIHTQNIETNNPNDTFNISCATRKSLRIKRKPNKSLLYHCYAVGEKGSKQ